MNASTVAPANILIADDQVDILEALQILVKNEGFVPHVVTTPGAALKAIRNQRFDVVLMDMNYAKDTTSGGEGLELLSQIRMIDSALPVVLMTAWGSLELAGEAMEEGGRQFVQKPWDNARLIAILQRQLHEGRMLREKHRDDQTSYSLLLEVADARETQERLLPLGAPRIPGCDVRTTWRPASDLSGDYFDVIPLGDSTVGFCIADVCGKGVPAALVMAHLRATMHAVAPTTRRPSELCRQVNRAVAETLPAGRFITMFYGVLDTATKRLRYTNAGHVPPLLTSHTGGFNLLEEGGTVLGAFPDAPYEEREISLNSGDRIVLFTDGITEAANANGDQFGRDRVQSIALQHHASPAEQLQCELLSAVSTFASTEAQDDATLLIISLL
jgi:sigma-B regulation protein RsbU (phosphoserine phosphatase)